MNREIVLQKALRAALPWLRRRYVVGIGIGQRHRGGTYVSGGRQNEVCITVTILEKPTKGELLAPGVKPFPASIRVRHAGRLHSVPVDVQHTGGLTALRLHGLVATPINLNGSLMGCVGAVVTSGTQAAVLTAGHVALAPGTHLTLHGGWPGTTASVQMTSRLDCGLIRLDPPPQDGDASFPNGQTLLGIRSIDASIIGETCFYRSLSTGKEAPRPVRNSSVSVPVPFPGQTGPTQMFGLIATDGSTTPGESGTILYDAQSLAVGTLIGDLGGLSYFVPCDFSFATLGLSLLP